MSPKPLGSSLKFPIWLLLVFGALRCALAMRIPISQVSRLPHIEQMNNEMHAEACRRSGRNYVCNKQSRKRKHDIGSIWRSWEFPGASFDGGIDAHPAGGFGQHDLMRSSLKRMFSQEFCDAVIEEAEKEGMWEEAGRFAHYAARAGCTQQVERLPQTLERLNEALDKWFFEAIKDAFPTVLSQAQLRIQNARIVKYNASAGQTELGIHRDGSLVTATIALNEEYTGGGTIIEALHHCQQQVAQQLDPLTVGNSLRVGAGNVILHPGYIRHGGAPITSGLRYILVCFLFDENRIQQDHYCMLRANQLLARALKARVGSEYRSDLLAAAVEAFSDSLLVGAANFTESAHLGMGQALLLQGAVVDAHPELQHAVKLAPRNIHAGLTLAEALSQLGKHAEALDAAKLALSLDPFSAPAKLLIQKLKKNLSSI